MKNDKYSQSLVVRITEQQLRMIVEQSIKNSITQSEFVRKTLNEKLNESNHVNR
jgi:predicted HicB family RNase H-like nuclease